MCTPVATRQDSLPPSWKTDSLRFVILLAEHDEPSLAAKKKQRHVALKTAASTPKNRVWDFFGSPLGQIRSESDLSAETATGSVQFSYETASGQAYYYTSDHLGSVREVCNSSGSIVARYSYDPYGRVTLVSGSNLATKQYTGDYYHAASGLNLTKYRAYDPNTGKWLSRDPKGENGGMNLYAYCHDKPIGLLDRLGLAAGTFDINFNPPTGGPANEPTPNGFNQPVQITYHKDPKECCKNIKLVQWARTNYETTPSYDTGGAPVNLSSPYNVAHTVPYPYQSSTADGATMGDEPGPDDFGSELSAAIVGYKEDFKVCAVCFDSYPFKVLGCRSWGVSMDFFGFQHHYGGGTNLPAEP